MPDRVSRVNRWIDQSWPNLVRLGGLGIALWQTLIEDLDRPYLLFLAAGMMGLKTVIEAQNRLKNGDGK